MFCGIKIDATHPSNAEEMMTRLTDSLETSLTHSARQVGTAGDVVEVARLHLLLVRLTVVEVVEVGHDDGHRKRYGQHASNSAQRADNLAPDADRSAAEVQDVAQGSPPSQRRRHHRHAGAQLQHLIRRLSAPGLSKFTVKGVTK